MYKYNLKLYKNTSENDDVVKNLTDEKIVAGFTRTVVDMLHPVIQLAGIEINIYNYCYVQELQRYYYIENVTAAPNGIYTLSMRVDVLMTYYDDIMASSGLITKNREYNPYMGEYDAESRYTLEKHEFENGFDYSKGDFVLITMRG